MASIQKVLTPYIVRASAVLTSAYVASASQPVATSTRGAFEVTYTQGAAGGCAQAYVETSADNGATWVREIVRVGAVDTGAPPEGVSSTYRDALKLPVPAGASAIRVRVQVDVATSTHVRLAVKEVGVPGTPGTCAVRYLEVIE